MRRFVSYAHVTSDLVAPLSDTIIKKNNKKLYQERDRWSRKKGGIKHPEWGGHVNPQRVTLDLVESQSNFTLN